MPDKKTLKKQVVIQINAVREILRRWDPMGLAPGELAPVDEYDEYVHRVVSMVAQGCSIQELAHYLEGLRTQETKVEQPAEAVANVIVVNLNAE